MEQKNSAPIDSEDQSNEVMIQIRCDCDKWLKADTKNQNVSCECGKSFAVTVTGISVNTSPHRN